MAWLLYQSIMSDNNFKLQWNFDLGPKCLLQFERVAGKEEAETHTHKQGPRETHTYTLSYTFSGLSYLGLLPFSLICLLTLSHSLPPSIYLFRFFYSDTFWTCTPTRTNFFFMKNLHLNCLLVQQIQYWNRKRKRTRTLTYETEKQSHILVDISTEVTE